MKILALVNQKGGVAKTTTAINLGSCLCALGKKVLIMDIDPQSNATKGLGITGFQKTTYDCLINDVNVKEAIYPTTIKGLDIVPSNIKLANAELELNSVMGRETILKDQFHSGFDYDFMLIDCNPALGLLTVNALCIAEGIIIPMEANIFSFEGIEQLVKVIHLIKKKLNNKLDIFGVLLTRVDARTNISKEFESQLHAIFKDKAFKTLIHQNVKINEAQTARIPVNHYDTKCTGSVEYMQLAKEVLKRV